MKGKILKIERNFPHEVRVCPEMYPVRVAEMRTKGINPFTWDELRELYSDRSALRMATKGGSVKVHYIDKIYVFGFKPGNIHNTASVPGILKFIKDNDALDMYTAALPHDGGYMTHLLPKDVCDKIFVDMVEYYHDLVECDGFFSGLFEDLGENTIEVAIEVAFATDAAMDSWDTNPELQEKARQFFSVQVINKEINKPKRPPLSNTPPEKPIIKKATKKAAKKKVVKKKK